MTRTSTSPAGATTAGVVHHRVAVGGGTTLHCVTAGDHGSPVLLVHGFPETWWTFRELIPLLASGHRVVAPDLRGLGDSGGDPGATSGAAAAEDLHALVGALGLGPVHVLGQDVAGPVVFRLATTHPEDVLSLTAVETALPGFGFEALADVARGGAWHVGVIASPGAAELVLAGRERRFLAEQWFPAMTRAAGAVTAEDLEEFTRALSRPGAWRAWQGLYSSALAEGEEFRALVAAGALRAPVLAVDGASAPHTATTMSRASAGPVSRVVLADAGHHVALEAPAALAAAVSTFTAGVDARRPAGARGTGA
ncbi:alpha/beta hydrolase [Kineococcus terrestris]|uniref:alpha/beta hydrolase n=1 Tax=Kineococcus terrestris TaxID=2044856 RepID=UPI0034DB7968